MRYWSTVLSLLLLVPSLAIAQSKLTPRPLDPDSADTFARAIEGSAVVRALVERLEASNVIVHVETVSQMPSGIGGMMRFVTSRGGHRYLRISLGATLTPKLRAAILGHELKHACEVADSSVTDIEGMRQLFENAGHRAGHYFDTSAAIAIERRVLLELQMRRPLRHRPQPALQAEPVAKFDH
jgi:hypothetical protein